MRRPVILIVVVATAALLLTTLFLPVQYGRVDSPDHRFYAVATFPGWQGYIPAGPGQAGDKSGHVTVYTADGYSCGRAPVDMVSFISDLKWSRDRAEIPVVAEWDLAHRRVHKLR
jgi:hypothetical protein